MSLKDGRARPKSHTFNLQSELARMFLGLRSRWNTLAARQTWRLAAGSYHHIMCLLLCRQARHQICIHCQPSDCLSCVATGLVAQMVLLQATLVTTVGDYQLMVIATQAAGDAECRPAVATCCTCVNVLQATQHLVEEELVMLWCQVIICLDHLFMSKSNLQPHCDRNILYRML